MFRSWNNDTITLLIITIHGRTKYSLIERDLDNHQTEIDFFGSVMKNLTLKPGSHIIVMVPAVPAAVSNSEYDYDSCVLSQVPQAEFNFVPGTAGTVQSGKRNLMSLCWGGGVLHSSLARKQEAKKQFCQLFLLRCYWILNERRNQVEHKQTFRISEIFWRRQ